MPPTGRQWRHLVAAAVVALLIAVGTIWLVQDDGDADRTTAGATPVPACGPTLREPTNGAGRHINSEPITYAAAPPSFGDHRGRWEVRASSFYDVEDRPEVAVLVHNLEHGYNILWYDQTVVDDSDALDQVREIADSYSSLGGAPDPATAFIAVPWTAADGAAFPDGMHYALTHWYADPTDRTRSRTDEAGLTSYCSGISGELVQDWMDTYPLSDAPEGFPDLM